MANPQQHNLQRIQVSRIFRDRALALVIRASGIGVLLLLTVLVWQLFTHSLPLAQTPKAEKTLEWQLPETEPLWLGDITQSPVVAGRVVDNNGKQRECRLALYTLSTHEIQARKIKEYSDNCSNSHYQFRNFNGQSYLATMKMEQDALTFAVKKITLDERGLVETSIFAIDLNSANDTTIGDWHWQMWQNRVQIAMQTKAGWQLFQLDRDRSEGLKKHSLNSDQRPLLLPRWQQLVIFNQQEIGFFSWPNQSITYQTTHAPVMKAWTLPAQTSFLLSLQNGQTSLWSGYNQNGYINFNRVANIDAQSPVLDARFHTNNNMGVLLHAQKLSFINLATAELVVQQTFNPAIRLLLNDNRLISLSSKQAQAWKIGNPAGISTWNSLWNRVWYDGYHGPDYIWQSAVGEGQVAKFSLMPLVIGSLKAALLAILVAVPLAVSAAVYSAFFAPPKVRTWIKPGIETLESIPSVLIGFIAVLWLAPVLDNYLLGLFLFILLLPLSLLLLTLLVSRSSRKPLGSDRSGFEFLAIFIFTGIIAILIFTLAARFQPSVISLFGWLNDDAKSTLVVAIALGIAIAPSIFALAEEALYAVPKELKQASFALGATRLQTLNNIVLKMAMPGILSAVTLGFGRAVGETMIILMVTGNTPIANWNFFADLRSLSANLAIELPKAHVGDLHYHVLFLSALLLFVFTFFINAVAEFLRSRMRKRYSDI